MKITDSKMNHTEKGVISYNEIDRLRTRLALVEEQSQQIEDILKEIQKKFDQNNCNSCL
jgi:outer membrane protein TolC